MKITHELNISDAYKIQEFMESLQRRYKMIYFDYHHLSLDEFLFKVIEKETFLLIYNEWKVEHTTKKDKSPSKYVPKEDKKKLDA